MKPKGNTNKKTDNYDSAIIALSENNPRLSLIELNTLFENVGGREGEATPNLIRIMDVEYLRNLLGNNESETVNRGITFTQLENFFNNSLGSDIEVFEELMNAHATIRLFGDNHTRRPVIQLSELGNFFQNKLNGNVELFQRIMIEDITRFIVNHETPVVAINELGDLFQEGLGGSIEIFEELMANRAIQALLGFDITYPSIEFSDVKSFFKESLGGDIEVFRRIMTDDVIRLLTDDLDNPIVALGDLGNVFRNNLGGNIEAFEMVIRAPGIIELLGLNEENSGQITFTALGDYCQQAIQNNSLEQALNNVQTAEDPVQQILGESIDEAE